VFIRVRAVARDLRMAIRAAPWSSGAGGIRL